MGFANEHPSRPLCAELLEGRWLLSTAAAPANPTASDSGHHEVVIVEELYRVDANDDADEVPVELSKVPEDVLEGFYDSFGGAKVLAASLGDDGAEYAITAQLGTREIEVTVSPRGKVLENETSLAPGEVPQAVIDKLREELGGSNVQLEQAMILQRRGGSEMYELVATDSKGVQWEGNFRIAEPPSTNSEAARGTATEFVQVTSGSTASNAFAGTVADEPAAAASTTRASVAAAAARAGLAAIAAAAAATVEAVNSATATSPAVALEAPQLAQDASARVTNALEALAAGRTGDVWVPEVAGTLVNVLPVNIDAVERGLQDVLDHLGLIAAPARHTSAVAPGASRIAMAVTLVAVVKMLLGRSRAKRGVGHALVFGTPRSSWDWILGTPPNSRRVTSRERRP